MAEQATPAETNGLAPVFQIQRVYLKESSLEQPNSPGILLVQEQPTVDIQLGVNAEPVADGFHYTSDTNDQWFTLEEITKILETDV